MKKILALTSLALALSACGATQSDVCKKYLECQKAVDELTGSNSVGALETQYGPEGSCWNDPASATACDAGCDAALKVAQADDKFKELAACKP